MIVFKRGFGDSTEVSDIRESTVVEDAHRALRYLRDTLGASSVIVWGHSQVLRLTRMNMKTMFYVRLLILTTLMCFREPPLLLIWWLKRIWSHWKRWIFLFLLLLINIFLSLSFLETFVKWRSNHKNIFLPNEVTNGHWPFLCIKGETGARVSLQQHGGSNCGNQEVKFCWRKLFFSWKLFSWWKLLFEL